MYWTNGCQIIPPHDKGIAAAILENLEPVTWDTSVVDDGHLLIEGSLGLVRDAYFRAVSAVAHIPRATVPWDDRFVYTPLHGIGLPFFTQAIQNLGLEGSMTVVAEQAQPDPDFPTIRFPNPEEKGALDLAIQTAEARGIALVVASDPDADRLAVVEKVDGRWRQLSGNQLGALLASHVLETYPADKPRERLAMLASTVSSRMLAAMAAAEGFHYAETLTGFKWLGNVAMELEAQGFDVKFAFEEAIGYMIPDVVRDKDAVAAAAVFMAAVHRWQKEEGLTPWGKLMRLYERYGWYEDVNTYVVSPSPAVTDRVFEDIRRMGEPYPERLGKRRILRWRDLTVGYDSATKDNVPELPVSKESQMITCEVEGDVRFTVRGSGTEPKIKLYVEGCGDSAEEARRKAEEVLEDLLKEWFKLEEYGLRTAS